MYVYNINILLHYTVRVATNARRGGVEDFFNYYYFSFGFYFYGYRCDRDTRIRYYFNVIMARDNVTRGHAGQNGEVKTYSLII